MKTSIILTFAAGAATGALVMWLLQPAAASGNAGNASLRPNADAVRLSEDKHKLAARVQALEKELAGGKQGVALADAGGPGGKAREHRVPQMFKSSFDPQQMDQMMRQRAGKDVNREVDRLALRLKLTPEQKESLRKFLMDRKEKEITAMSSLRLGGVPDIHDLKTELSKMPSKDEFLKSLLSADQQSEYARSQDEQRKSRAEEYAQRKVRKLNNDLNLSEEQKDKLFQAYAQKKLTAADAGPVASGGDIVADRVGASISVTRIVGGDAAIEPIEIDMPFDDVHFSGAGGDLDRETMQGILTPEQLSVYDQRKNEEQEQMKSVFRIEGGAAVLPPSVEIK